MAHMVRLVLRDRGADGGPDNDCGALRVVGRAG